MGKVRVAGFGVSVDGFGAGTDQSLENPLGAQGPGLFQWYFPTRSFREMHGGSGGETGTDNEFARRAMEGFGAFILGRNMFGPIRGEWPDDVWKGWWGDNPPYPRAHLHPDPPPPRVHVEMEGRHDLPLRHRRHRGGAGPVPRPPRATWTSRSAAASRPCANICSPASVDELHLALSPVVLGRGEPLFHGIDLPGLGYRVTEAVPTERATHLVLTR